ncbi:MAG: ketoreductase domain-containing protein, partial [Promethearchaeia archaeon]
MAGDYTAWPNASHTSSLGLARSARAEAPQLPLTWIHASMRQAFARQASILEPEAVIHVQDVLVPRLTAAPLAEASVAYATHSGSHLITGGTGGLGLLTARWLAQHGGRVLTLTSRGGQLDVGLAGEWAQIRAASVSALPQVCDLAETVHVRRVSGVGHGLHDATGVWHAAGVLMDALLPNQRADHLQRVFAPKAHGAWTLQRTHASVPLRTCALFSSVASLLGGGGQANYSAANACLDALATCRRTHGVAAASVQWGAWAEVGMAARGAAAERMAAMETASGFGRLGLAQGLGALHAAVLPRASSLVGVMPVQWGRMLRDGAVPAFLSSMAAPALAKEGSVATVEQRVACAISSLEAVLEMVRRTAG